MNSKEFKEEILTHYLDRDLQVTIDRDPTPWSTGNGLLHTGLFYVLLHLNNLITEEDRLRFTKCVDGCWAGPDDAATVGVLERNPNRPDKQAHDDYQGVMAASFLLKTYHAAVITQYGENHNWSFNNEHPDEFSLATCHARFVDIVPFYKLAASVELSAIDKMRFKLAVNLGPSEAHDGSMMQWLRIQVAKAYPDEFGSQISSWDERFEKQFQSLGKLFEPYFGSHHPFSQITSITGVF